MKAAPHRGLLQLESPQLKRSHGRRASQEWEGLWGCTGAPLLTYHRVSHLCLAWGVPSVNLGPRLMTVPARYPVHFVSAMCVPCQISSIKNRCRAGGQSDAIMRCRPSRKTKGESGSSALLLENVFTWFQTQCDKTGGSHRALNAPQGSLRDQNGPPCPQIGSLTGMPWPASKEGH